MSWGTELWDKYEDLCTYSTTGIDFLEKSVAEFIKERGKVEKEYAKNLRTLVKKYMPKATKVSSEASKNNDNGPASIVMKAMAEEEFTHILAYKEVRLMNHQVKVRIFSRPFDTPLKTHHHALIHINHCLKTMKISLPELFEKRLEFPAKSA